MKKSGLMLLVATILWGGVLLAQGSPNVPLLAHINDYPSVGYNDCWGYVAPDGREYALLGVQNGTSILDITDTDNIVEINFISSATSLWKDIKTYQHYAYVVTEASGGMQIIDLSDLPNSAPLIGSVTEFGSSHNIYIDVPNALLYVEGSFSEPVWVYSLADPENPVRLSDFGIECHDIFARDNIAFISEGGSGSIGIFDMANPSQPALLQRLNIPAAGYVHNAWMTEDSQFLMTTEETNGKTMKMWDISDLGNITLTDQILAPGGLAHNTHIKGNYAYVSHYSDGLRIYDVSDPYNLSEAGFYDTSDDWGAYPFFPSGKVLVSDIDDGLYIVFFEGAREGDPLDPNAPKSVAAYSDFNTPNSIQLTWEDPTNLFNGDTLTAAEFTIEVAQIGGSIVSVAGGSGAYEATGLSDGELYEFEIYTKIIANDSTSNPVKVNWYAGGSPFPAAPANLVCENNGADALLSWDDPAIQADGTPLDDLDRIEILRDGEVVGSVAPGSESFVDTPAPGFAYEYAVRAVDNELPENVSKLSNNVVCYVGDAPEFIVWVGSDAGETSAASGDSLFAAIAAHGGSVYLTNNLFEFGTDLSGYKAVFVVLGVFSDNHVLSSSDPEAAALETYLTNGGKVYLEGGDCFNYDPEQGGYNIRSWFGLNDGEDGSGDVFGVTGQNAIGEFAFGYNGPNNWMDELVPASAAPIWKNSDNTDVLGVYNDSFGNGLAIGVVPSFGGLVETGGFVAPAIPNSGSGTGEKIRPVASGERRPFVKKYAYFPQLAEQWKGRNFVSLDETGNIVMSAGNKVELMGAYLQLLGAPITGIDDDPVAAPATFALSQNYPNPFNPTTTFSVALPENSDLIVTVFNALGQPVAELFNGKIAAGEHKFSFDAAHLASGLYFYRVSTGKFTQTRKMILMK